MNTPPRIEGEPTADEQRALNGLHHYRKWDSGYSIQQATRPQTLAYGLTDSPAGQAAWILEKFWAWTDCDGHPENIFTRDELLDNVMVYWVTASAASSARLYWESFGKGSNALPVDVPTGVAVFPKKIVTPVRSWMEPSSRTSGTGRRCPGAGTLQRSNSRRCSLRTCGSFSALCDRVAAVQQQRSGRSRAGRRVVPHRRRPIAKRRTGEHPAMCALRSPQCPAIPAASVFIPPPCRSALGVCPNKLR